jgi:hypothetical protein
MPTMQETQIVRSIRAFLSKTGVESFGFVADRRV